MTDDNIPTAIAENEMDFLGHKVKVYVLNDGRRIIEAGDMARILAALTADPEDDGDAEICEGCEKTLRPGDLCHRCDDGPVLCEECAPTFNDIRREYDRAKKDGSFDTMFAFPEDAPDNDAALDSHIAAGDGDKKHVWPL